MAQGIDFPGSNKTYTSPGTREGTPDDRVRDLHVFTNGVCIVSCWKLTPEEIEEVNKTGCIFISIMSAPQLYPFFVGSEKNVRDVIQDFGGAWKREGK